MPSHPVASRATAALVHRLRTVTFAVVGFGSFGCTPLRELSSYSDAPAATGALADTPAVGGSSSSAPAPLVGEESAPPDASTPATGAPDAGNTIDAGAPSPCDAPGELAGAAGHCYWLVTEVASWNASSAACAEWGGTLARIDSPEEESLLSQSALGDTWIGLNDIATEGEMRWDGGGALGVYSHWAPDQPDDFDGTEDCVELLADGRGYNDRPCTDLRAHLCER